MGNEKSHITITCVNEAALFDIIIIIIIGKLKGIRHSYAFIHAGSK